MEYPAEFTLDQEVGGYVVTFPDVPEAITQGDTLEEATDMAEDALALALTFYVDRWERLPAASSADAGKRLVRVPAAAESKFTLYGALRSSGLGKADLMRLMKCPASRVDEILDANRPSNIDEIEMAFAAIGKKLTVPVREAA